MIPLISKTKWRVEDGDGKKKKLENEDEEMAYDDNDSDRKKQSENERNTDIRNRRATQNEEKVGASTFGESLTKTEEELALDKEAADAIMRGKN